MNHLDSGWNVDFSLKPQRGDEVVQLPSCVRSSSSRKTTVSSPYLIITLKLHLSPMLSNDVSVCRLSYYLLNVLYKEFLNHVSLSAIIAVCAACNFAASAAAPPPGPIQGSLGASQNGCYSKGSIVIHLLNRQRQYQRLNYINLHH